MRSAGSAAAKGAVPGAADAALNVMDDEEWRARMASALATPEMQRAMREVSSGLAQGVVTGLSSDELSAHMNKLVQTFMRALARGLEDLAPAMTTITREAVDAALDSTMSPAHQRQIEQFTSTIVASMMKSTAQEIPRSLAPAMGQAIREEVGPAIREMMHKDVTPGIAEMVRSPEFKIALGETTREVARQAVLGSNEGLAELAEQRRKDRGGNPLGVIGAFFAARTWLLVALITAAVLAIPLLWLMRERRLARRYRDEAEHRNARAAALLGAMEAAPDGAWSSKMLDMLREQLLWETTKPKKRSKRKKEKPSDGPPPDGNGSAERHD